MIQYTRQTGSELVFEIIDELIRDAERGDLELIVRRVIDTYDFLESSRPASIAAINTIRMIGEYILERGLDNLKNYLNALRSKYDTSLWRAVEVASRRIDNGDSIITNSNSLSIRRLLSTLRDQGKQVRIYVTESRPGREGLMLAEYASKLGFETYLIVDSATRFFMKNIEKVFVGAEGIAANGAVIAKIGTSILALVAKEARKRVFVIAPSIKFSFESIHGELLKIPEGGAELLVDPKTDRDLPEGYIARVPLYDVTPSEYIDAIATEYGLVAPQAVPLVLRNIYGEYPPRIVPLQALIKSIREKYMVR